MLIPNMASLNRRLMPAALLAAVSLLLSAKGQADSLTPYSPDAFTSLGSLTSSGAYSINFFTGTMTGPSGFSVMAVLGSNNELVFTFDQISLDATSSISMDSFFSNAPVVLLSKSSVTLNGTAISRFGGGISSTSTHDFALNPLAVGMSPASLVGGEEGNSVSLGEFFGSARGGSGGGALELGAATTLTLQNATIQMRGQPGENATFVGGNGGAGGTVFLHGVDVALTGTTIDVSGGDGGANQHPGATVKGNGGGGGYIQIQASRPLISSGNALLVDGGSTPFFSYQGPSGSIVISIAPEPASVALLGITILPMMGLIRRRRV